MLVEIKIQTEYPNPTHAAGHTIFSSSDPLVKGGILARLHSKFAALPCSKQEGCNKKWSQATR